MNPGSYDEALCSAGSGLLGHQVMTKKSQTRLADVQCCSLQLQ